VGDLISRADALDAIDNERKMLIEQGRFGAEHIVVHYARRIIEKLPGADATVVIHAKWKDIGNETVSCNHCGTLYPKECVPYLRYCGWCGAKKEE